MSENIFIEIGIIIIIAVVISGVLKQLRQPLIIGYIFTGIVAGPFLLNIVQSPDMLIIFSQFGIAFLLFIAGLSLNPKVFKSVGLTSFITGIGQILFTSIIGFFIAKLFGFSDIASLYISIALTFSSTIIIVKLLSDKGDLQTLYGRISVGFLLVQDIFAILILMIISTYFSGFDISSIDGKEIFAGAVLLVIIGLFALLGLPRITRTVARSGDYLLLFSTGWLLLLSITFYSLNLSMEIGALLAGISMSVSPHNYEIRLKMNVLSDFFIIFFFVLLGTQMIIAISPEFILPVAVFSLFILIGNPIIVMVLMGAMKHSKRNGFMAGLTVAQISEFSLILAALGVKVGHLSQEILSMITAIGLITILGSTYLILYAHRIYPMCAPYLGIFERKDVKLDENIDIKQPYDIILFGYNRIGFNLLESIRNMGKNYLVIDHDPEIIAYLEQEGYECVHGDAHDMELLKELDFSRTQMVISTLPDFETNLFLLRKVREDNADAICIFVSHQIEDTYRLYEHGASYVIMPYFLGARYAAQLIKKYGFDAREFGMEKMKHLNRLEMRERLKQEHPNAEKHT